MKQRVKPGLTPLIHTSLQRGDGLYLEIHRLAVSTASRKLLKQLFSVSHVTGHLAEAR